MNIEIKVKIAAISLTLALAGCGGGGGGGGGGSSVSEVGTQEADLPEVTWYSAAEPLMQRYCVACHTDGGPAPFPLESYGQVYAKRSAMEYVLEAQTMPPLGFADLTPAQQELLLDWLAAGAPQGNESQSPLKQVVSGFTYHGDTRTIIEEYCVTCHIDGGVAPFPLDSYEKVKGVAAAAAFAVQNGTMPPWPPTKGYSRFAHERVLPSEDEFALANWLAGDLAEGDPADYVPAVQIEGESEGIDFNLKLPLPQPYTPKLRPDDHRCFAIDWPLDDFAYVTAVDVIPDQVAEVHHVIVNIIEPKDVGPYLAAGGQDGQAGWPCLLSGGLPGSPLPRQIGGWVPGAGNGAGPKGTGIGVDPDSIMVVQMHYNTLVAEPTPDQSIVLVATTDKVERPASGFLYTNPFWLSPGGMPIPAGEPEVRHSFEVPTGILATLFGAPAGVAGLDKWAMHTGFLHMHNLGETGRVTLIRKNGTEQVVVDIRDWDFNWQSTYGLQRELLVEPGDSVRLECSWDNSASNQTLVDGEQLPPRDVEWGDGTGDEMCLTNFLMTVPKEGYDYSYSASVHIETPAYRQIFAVGDLVPLELLFNNFSLYKPGAHGDEHGGDHAGVYEGHYHVYLDTDDDSAEHLTAWDAKYFYQLPEDLEPGQHTLRVSLRGTDHHALGIEQSVVIDVLENTAAAPLQLIDVNDWAEQAAADDSHASHRPAVVECPDNSWDNEDGALEVETGFCNYLSVSQGSKAALGQGDNLHLVLWHGNLASEQKATAHVAITIAGKTVWQEEVEIPTDANIYDLRVPIDFDAPADSKVEFHLHNHGYNTWTLLQLELER
jgi:mono/diheme cytochrome c family protein